MIHASVELLEAMKGVCPANSWDDHDSRGAPAYHEACSGAEGEGLAQASREWLEDGALRCDVVVECPDCLRLMREADPVRWDACEERGLVSLKGAA